MTNRSVSNVGPLLLIIGITCTIDRYFEIQRLRGIQQHVESARSQSEPEDAFPSIQDNVGFGVDAAVSVLKLTVVTAVIGGVLWGHGKRTLNCWYTKDLR